MQKEKWYRPSMVPAYLMVLCMILVGEGAVPGVWCSPNEPSPGIQMQGLVVDEESAF